MREDNDLSHNFREILKDYKIAAKRAVERMDMISQSPMDSPDWRIHNDVMQEEIKPRVEEQGRDIYSAILSYNKNPQEFKSLKREDVLEAQLAMDEVTEMLRQAGIQTIFSRDPDTF